MEDPKPIITVKKLWGMASENDVDMLLQHLPKEKKKSTPCVKGLPTT